MPAPAVEEGPVLGLRLSRILAESASSAPPSPTSPGIVEPPRASFFGVSVRSPAAEDATTQPPPAARDFAPEADRSPAAAAAGTPLGRFQGAAAPASETALRAGTTAPAEGASLTLGLPEGSSRRAPATGGRAKENDPAPEGREPSLLYLADVGATRTVVFGSGPEAAVNGASFVFGAAPAVAGILASGLGGISPLGPLLSPETVLGVGRAVSGDVPAASGVSAAEFQCAAVSGSPPPLLPLPSRALSTGERSEAAAEDAQGEVFEDAAPATQPGRVAELPSVLGFVEREWEVPRSSPAPNQQGKSHFLLSHCMIFVLLFHGTAKSLPEHVCRVCLD